MVLQSFPHKKDSKIKIQEKNIRDLETTKEKIVFKLMVSTLWLILEVKRLENSELENVSLLLLQEMILVLVCIEYLQNLVIINLENNIIDLMEY